MTERKKKYNKDSDYPFESMDRVSLSRALHSHEREVYRWLDLGCPRNADGTFSLFEVHKWHIGQLGETKTVANLDTQKLIQQIKKLEIENAKNEAKYMLRDDHENIMAGRAASLRIFLESAFILNIGMFVMRSGDELRALWFDFVKRAMEAFTGTKTQDV